jgi:hypothetical protein
MALNTPFNIETLKKELGPGLGLRKAKYLVEIPISSSKKLNMLCMSTSLPERNMSTVSVMRYGRKYNMRGETEYPGTYEINITDDSEMNIRHDFDSWMYAIDNSNKLESSSSETLSDIDVMPEMKDGKYTRTVNVWQLASDGVTAVRGYQLQNAFPSSIGTVALEDGEENSLSEFSVVFSYSEFIPLKAGKVFG